MHEKTWQSIDYSWLIRQISSGDPIRAEMVSDLYTLKRVTVQPTRNRTDGVRPLMRY